MLPATVFARALIFLAGVSCTVAHADASLDYEVKLTAEYREASSSIKVLDKYASFRVGGVGVRVQANPLVQSICYLDKGHSGR